VRNEPRHDLPQRFGRGRGGRRHLLLEEPQADLALAIRPEPASRARELPSGPAPLPGRELGPPHIENGGQASGGHARVVDRLGVGVWMAQTLGGAIEGLQTLFEGGRDR